MYSCGASNICLNYFLTCVLAAHIAFKFHPKLDCLSRQHWFVSYFNETSSRCWRKKFSARNALPRWNSSAIPGDLDGMQNSPSSWQDCMHCLWSKNYNITWFYDRDTTYKTIGSLAGSPQKECSQIVNFSLWQINISLSLPLLLLFKVIMLNNLRWSCLALPVRSWFSLSPLRKTLHKYHTFEYNNA